jgi:L-cysteine desulfidase
MEKVILKARTILDLLKDMTCTCMGCTEPVAIALAVATAYKTVGGEVKSVEVELSANVFKNTLAVGIPGTDQKGPYVAAALALIVGDPAKGLLILAEVTPEDVAKANELLTKDIIKLALDSSATGLKITAKLATTAGKAKAIISGRHDNIILIEKNDEVIYSKELDIQCAKMPFIDIYDLDNIDLQKIIEEIEQISIAELMFLQEGYELNKKAAELGLAQPCGMMLGVAYKKLIETKQLEDTVSNRIKMLVSAASDARMGGKKIPIFCCSGSGNHGIIYFLTIGTYLQNSQANILHVYAFGLVLLAIIKKYTGLLSPICGAAVGVGAAVAGALVYAGGGSIEQITNAVDLVFGNIAGEVCDGAKYGCALKIASASTVAIESALLALGGIKIPCSDGIIGKDFKTSLTDLGMLNNSGMSCVDTTILQLLQAKP